MVKHSASDEYEVTPINVVLPSCDDTRSNNDVTLMSEAALAVDWNRPEEYEAWGHLQHEK